MGFYKDRIWCFWYLEHAKVCQDCRYSGQASEVLQDKQVLKAFFSYQTPALFFLFVLQRRQSDKPIHGKCDAGPLMA